MKQIKYLFAIITTILGVFSMNTLDVYAMPNSVTVKSKSSLYYFSEKHGTDYISGYNFYRKELTDGTFVYCISNIDTSVPAGKTLTLKGEITDKGLEYILTNGYPYKSFTGSDLKDYYITQSAIWEYFDETRGSKNWRNTEFTSSSTGMKGYVYQLVSEAKKAKTTEVTSPIINIIYTNKEMTLSSDGRSFISDHIRVEMDGTVGTYTVSLENASSDTKITNINGDSQTKFKNGEEFIVTTPNNGKSGTIKLVVSSNSTKSYKTYEYESSKSKDQNVALVEEVSKPIKAEIELKFTSIVTKVSISKQDITTKEELPGATLVIKDKSGKVVDTWVSTNKPHYVEGLAAGDYTLTETIAPDGYKLSTSTINFTLKADGKVESVVMYNSRQELTKVNISKQDITTKEELPGATLVIKDKSGKVVDTWVSTNKPHYVEGLAEGDYTLTETIAPNGYKLSTSTISFTLKADGKVESVVMYNEKYSVPITDLNASSMVIVGALFIMALGTGLVFYGKHAQ